MPEPRIGRFDGNNYDLTRKELRQARKELQEDLGLSKSEAKAHMKEIKEHIKAGDLGQYLDQLGDDIKGVMGLHLSSKMEKIPPKADLDELIQDIKNLDIASADKKEAFNTILPFAPFVAATVYGSLDSETVNGVGVYLDPLV